jgi:hypothetical protein
MMVNCFQTLLSISSCAVTARWTVEWQSGATHAGGPSPTCRSRRRCSTCAMRCAWLGPGPIVHRQLDMHFVPVISVKWRPMTRPAISPSPACHVTDKRFNARFLSRMASYDAASDIWQAPLQTMPALSPTRISNPRCLSQMASYDVASDICRALA